MMNKMRGPFYLYMVALFLFHGSLVCVRGANEADLQKKCANDFTKVAVCLSFATGKAATPTKDCCDSVKGIKETDPECLCYIIQQTHNGNQQVKQMGVQEAKILQLPSACNLKNASVADCPKLLGLSPSSPGAAIFTNVSSSAPASSTTGTKPTSASENSGSSSGTKIGPQLTGLLAIAMAIVSYSYFLEFVYA